MRFCFLWTTFCLNVLPALPLPSDGHRVKPKTSEMSEMVSALNYSHSADLDIALEVLKENSAFVLAHAHQLAWIPAQKTGNEMFVKTVILACAEKPWFSSAGPVDLRICCHRVWQAHAWYFRCDQLCVSSPACLASAFCQRPGHGEVELVPFFTLCPEHQRINREEFVSYLLSTDQLFPNDTPS